MNNKYTLLKPYKYDKEYYIPEKYNIETSSIKPFYECLSDKTIIRFKTMVEKRQEELKIKRRQKIIVKEIEKRQEKEHFDKINKDFIELNKKLKVFFKKKVFFN